MKELNEFRGVEMEANDEKKEVGFQENTSNITLPSGCMTSNQIYVAPESDQSEKNAKIKRENQWMIRRNVKRISFFLLLRLSSEQYICATIYQRVRTAKMMM